MTFAEVVASTHDEWPQLRDLGDETHLMLDGHTAPITVWALETVTHRWVGILHDTHALVDAIDGVADRALAAMQLSGPRSTVYAYGYDIVDLAAQFRDLFEDWQVRSPTIRVRVMTRKGDR